MLFEHYFHRIIPLREKIDEKSHNVYANLKDDGIKEGNKNVPWFPLPYNKYYLGLTFLEKCSWVKLIKNVSLLHSF